MNSSKKTLTLSIIIPAYNEERYIEKCLDSIKNQTMKPDEVILVDNNCTDKTIELAKKYEFVTIVKETKQGMAHARDKGFSVAKGDILGRIDVDANLTPNWVKVVKDCFSDDSLSAITGPGITSTTPFIRGKQIFPSLRTAFWSKLYLWIAKAVMRVVVLWGANMAIRASVWDVIKDEVCDDDSKVHEDQDLSLLLAGKGFRSKIIHGLDIKTDGTTYFFWPKFWEYFIRSFKTISYRKKLHTLENPKAIRVSWVYTVFVITICLIPALAFICVSYLFFIIPAQALKLRLSFSKN